jgi:hypothetical protein
MVESLKRTRGVQLQVYATMASSSQTCTLLKSWSISHTFDHSSTRIRPSWNCRLGHKRHTHGLEMGNSWTWTPKKQKILRMRKKDSCGFIEFVLKLHLSFSYLNFISKEVIVGIFSQLPTTSLQLEWEVCPQGGSWELIKLTIVVWFKMEDACNFLRVLKSLCHRKVTNIESGGPLGPFILHVTLAHSW